jgi:hypothetical protein
MNISTESPVSLWQSEYEIYIYENRKLGEIVESEISFSA